jgi:hypothetical protein
MEVFPDCLQGLDRIMMRKMIKNGDEVYPAQNSNKVSSKQTATPKPSIVKMQPASNQSQNRA